MTDRDEDPPTDPKAQTDPKIRETQRSEQATKKHHAFTDGEIIHQIQISFDNSLRVHGAEIQKDLKRIEEKINVNANRSVEEHEKTRKHFGTVASAIKTLWHRVFDTPPPADLDYAFGPEAKTDPHKKPTVPRPAGEPKPLAQQVSDHDASIAGIHGNVIALDAELKAHRAETQEARLETRKDLDAVKRQIGVRETEGRSNTRKLVDMIVSLFTTARGLRTIGTIIAALGYWYAISTGRLPTPAERHQEIHEAVPKLPPHPGLEP